MNKKRAAGVVATLCAFGVVSALVVVARDRDGETSAFDYVRARYRVAADHGTGFGVFPATLADALPNVEVRDEQIGRVGKFTNRIVDGTVRDVRRGRGFWNVPDAYDPTEGALGTPQPVDFDDPRAQWRELLVVLSTDDGSVELVWAIDGPRSLYGTRRPTPDPDDPEKVAAGLKALGRVIVLVDDRDGVSEMTPAYTLTVGADDRVDAVFREESDTWVGALSTAAEVKNEARKPTRTIGTNQGSSAAN